MRARVAIAAAILCASRAARADDWRGVELGGTAGVGTPLGTVGVELETIVFRTLAIAGGAGLGPGGPAAAIQPRLFLTPDGHGFYAGLGASVSGEHFQLGCDGCLVDPLEDGTAYWANVEVGYEQHWGGSFVRGFVGFSAMLDEKTVCEASTDCNTKVPYVGISIGAVIGSSPPAVAAPRTPPAPYAPPGAAIDPGLRELTEMARDAASRARCDIVRQLDVAVAKRDRAYHDGVFVADPSIAACLE